MKIVKIIKIQNITKFILIFNKLNKIKFNKICCYADEMILMNHQYIEEIKYHHIEEIKYNFIGTNILIYN